jgi:AAA domain
MSAGKSREQLERANNGTGVVSAADLLTMHFRAPRWAVPGLIPEGLNILAGRPKIGKSWLALNLALAVDAGGPFLGRRPALTGSVLYLALEDSPRRIQSRLAALVGEKNLPSSLYFQFKLPRIDQQGLLYLRDLVEKYPERRLVILDVFNRVRPPKKKDVDPYQQDAEVAAQLHEFAAQQKICLLVVHHDRKASAADWIDAISGTLGLTGSADAVMLLTRERGTSRGRLQLTGRDVEEKDLAIEFSNGLWQETGPGEDLEETPERQKILEALRARTVALGPTDISMVTGLPYDSVKQLLRKLHDNGMVNQPARGLYTVHSVHQEVTE